MRTSRETYRGFGLNLSVYRFSAEGDATGITLLFLHGFMDSGVTWDQVAEPLCAAGHEVLAIDFRGFGTSDRIGAGGYYHFPDYSADVDALLRQLAIERLVLVGHSMGGTVACLYAGARPDRMEKLVLLEGIGPPAMAPETVLHRTRTWLDQLERERGSRPIASLEQAAKRLGVTHSNIDRSILERVAAQLTEERDDGTRRWRHDRLHATTMPSAFNLAAFEPFLNAITCPVLFVGGGPQGLHPVDEDARLAAIGGAVQRIELPSAGHMMHWTQPREVAAVLLPFIDGQPPAPAD